MDDTPVHSDVFSQMANDAFDDIGEFGREAAYVGAGALIGRVGGAAIGAFIGSLTGGPPGAAAGAYAGQWLGAGVGAGLGHAFGTVYENWMDGNYESHAVSVSSRSYDPDMFRLTGHTSNASDGSTTWTYAIAGGYTMSYVQTASQDCKAITLTGTNYGDYMHGCDVNNTIYGNNGADTLWGWGGNDILKGGAGLDTIYGGTGNDRLYAGGDDGNALNGDAGKDTLFGEGGYSWMRGGPDADHFVFSGSDRVVDFNKAQGDYATGLDDVLKATGDWNAAHTRMDVDMIKGSNGMIIDLPGASDWLTPSQLTNAGLHHWLEAA